ncbi:hypothetical protein JI664_07215 [Rhodobacter sp. NTK016B]|uniref:hypothetical protein n=1 Tax=Rhodobacter sp. NTK016B TaxID=2759676 RepID=UPI001A8E8CC5|nr:hypothetical protein [Rhodobacter sp. NTK016B]MBN8291748.1 hypothetical protein [Rhodobacter sp. NTK016B]
MSRILRPSAPPSPAIPSALVASARGAGLLFGLALVAGAATLVPVRGEVLALVAAIAGMLAVPLIVPQPERHLAMALSWSALALGLPLALVLTHPELALGAALTLGAAGAWTALACLACRRM